MVPYRLREGCNFNLIGERSARARLALLTHISPFSFRIDVDHATTRVEIVADTMLAARMARNISA